MASPMALALAGKRCRLDALVDDGHGLSFGGRVPSEVASINPGSLIPGSGTRGQGLGLVQEHGVQHPFQPVPGQPDLAAGLGDVAASGIGIPLVVEAMQAAASSGMGASCGARRSRSG